MPKPTEWWFRPVISAARVGEQSAVVWKRLYRSPSSPSRSSVGVLIGPPKPLGLPKPASSVSTSRTFGAPSGAGIGATWFQSGWEPSSVRFTTP